MSHKNKQMKIRLPDELKRWIKERALKNFRPMNSEINILLQEAKEKEKQIVT